MLPNMIFTEATLAQKFEIQKVENDIKRSTDRCLELYDAHTREGKNEVAERLDMLRQYMMEMMEQNRVLKLNVANLVKHYDK